MCFCNVIRDLCLRDAALTNSDAFPDSQSTLKFRHKLHQASRLQNRKQAVSVLFTYIFTYFIWDDPQTNPVHIPSTWWYTQESETFKYPHILPFRCKLSARSTPAGANSCQTSVETNCTSAAQCNWATDHAGLTPAHVSAKTASCLLWAAHLKKTTALRVPPISQQQSKELLQWNVKASFPGSLAMGPFAVLQVDLLNSCQSYVLAAETYKNSNEMFSCL